MTALASPTLQCPICAGQFADEGDPMKCPNCHHTHTAQGCTGPPSPSDLWAGVTPAVCDCDTTNHPRPGEADCRRGL
jgi:hypothetical protein